MPGGMAPVDVKSYSDHELLQLVRSKAVLMTISINLPDLDHAALAMTAAPGRRAPFTTSPSPVEVDSHFDAGLSMWAWNVPDAAKSAHHPSVVSKADDCTTPASMLLGQRDDREGANSSMLQMSHYDHPLSTTSSLADSTHSLEMPSSCDCATTLCAWFNLDASDSGFEVGQDALASHQEFHLEQMTVAWPGPYSSNGEAAPSVGVTDTLKIADDTADEQLSFFSLQELANNDAAIAELCAVDEAGWREALPVADATTGPSLTAAVSHPSLVSAVSDDVNATLASMFRGAMSASS